MTNTGILFLTILVLGFVACIVGVVIMLIEKIGILATLIIIAISFVVFLFVLWMVGELAGIHL